MPPRPDSLAQSLKFYPSLDRSAIGIYTTGCTLRLRSRQVPCTTLPECLLPRIAVMARSIPPEILEPVRRQGAYRTAALVIELCPNTLNRTGGTPQSPRSDQRRNRQLAFNMGRCPTALTMTALLRCCSSPLAKRSGGSSRKAGP